jgi:osmotically-inducible protein OsmY
MKRASLAVMAIMMTALVFAPAVIQAQNTGGGKYDQEIQQKLTKQIEGKSKYKDVKASVEDGVVTLTGTVPVYIDKLDLDKKAHNTDHVQGVRNQIEVSSNVSDADLQKKLADKLAYDRIGYGIMFNSLNLGVHNGIVTVGGNVHDYPSRDSALAIVETQPGVKGVIDNIEVAPASPMDDELRIRTAQAIYGDPVLRKYAMVPSAPIRIVVDRGHVTLEGVVDSQMDKQIIDSRARSVPGAFSVTDNLVVAGGKTK